MKSADELKKELAALEGKQSQAETATSTADIDAELAELLDFEKYPVRPDEYTRTASITDAEIKQIVRNTRTILYHLRKRA